MANQRLTIGGYPGGMSRSRVITHRTLLRPLPRAIAIGLLYALTASAAVSATRFDGSVAFIWVANAVLVAELAVSPRSRHLATLLSCGVASAVATALFGFGPEAAGPLAAVNLLESMTAYAALCRLNPRRGPLDSLRGITGFVLSVGVVGPAVSAIGGATVAQSLGHGAFATNWLHWYAGHALGALTFMPLATFALRGEVRQWITSVNRVALAEATAVLGLMAAVSFAVFYQTRLPLLFLPMLPLMIATFRLGRFGAAASVTILAVVGGVLTLTGHGPVDLIDASQGARMQFLQFYLAVVVLTALPVSADLTRRKRLFLELCESEARYRLLADNSSDIVMNIDRRGLVRYVSPSISAIGGYEPAAVLDRPAIELVLAEDHAAVQATHLDALARPDQTHVVEHRGVTAGGETRWYETHTRGVRGEDGDTTGVVSAIRDITHRKHIEARLAQDADTDALTGLANRRAFLRTIDQALATGRNACIAFLDIDHFKQVNDRHGHPAGDAVLQRFAAIALQTVRDSDVVARIGGEEFAVLLRGAGIEEAAMVCERLRASVAAAVITGEGHTPIRITVSTGIVPLDLTRTPADLFRAADDALYRAKTAGRNRLELAA